MKALVRISLALALVVSLVGRSQNAEAGIISLGSYAVIGGVGSVKPDIRMIPFAIVGFTLSITYALVGPLGWGLIVLEDDSAIVSLRPLDVISARSLDLSENERLAFNANVDVFNAILEELEATVGEDATYEEVKLAWNYYLDQLQVEQDARFALTAVADHFVEQVSKELGDRY